MLFNSPTFLFGFLPISLIVFYVLSSLSREAAKDFLIVISLVFYGWGNAKFLPLLIGSVVVNYFLGRMIQTFYQREETGRVSLVRNIGVAGNLALLVYFKYTNFFLANINAVTGNQFHLFGIILPLGISFFTFQRIGYLVDCARGEISKSRFKDFATASLLFPQLISGPIVLYNELAPQIESRFLGSHAGRNATVGLVIFAIGLFKKAVIADNTGYICDPIFDAVSHGATVSLAAAWVGTLSYTVQLYFDFSGYSDMAIGAARMFGFRLPLNFHSPLRASSIIEYWRRWHMTLSRFMVHYFYQPLSLVLMRASMRSPLSPRLTFLTSVLVPVFLTFVVLGIWHGAGWTYVLFGVFHATCVSVNEIWRDARKRRRKRAGRSAKTTHAAIVERAFGHTLTLLCVLVANVMFRANTVGTAFVFYKGMFGFVGDASFSGFYRPEALLIVVAGWLIIALFPNTQQIVGAYRPAVNWAQWRNVAVPFSAHFIRWRPNPIGLASIGFLLAGAITVTIMEMSREPAQFIYFKF